MMTIVRYGRTQSQRPGDDFQLVDTHDLHGAGVLPQGIVERDFVVRQPELSARFRGFVYLLGQPDEFLDDLVRGDSPVLVMAA